VIEPLYDRIIVQQDPERETIGNTGLVAAEQHREKPLLGTVVAIGNGRLLDNGQTVPLRIGVNDRVVFGRHSGLNLPKDLGLGEDLLMMREDEVIGVLRPAAGNPCATAAPSV
jgi:chaperonin GroES